MAEPISQVVASMPRARFVGPDGVVPRAGGRRLHAVLDLPADRDDGLSTYTSDSAGGYHFAGLANFVDAAHGLVLVEAILERGQNNLIFFCVHMAVQNPIGIALAGLLSLPGLKLKGLYRTMIFLPTMLSVVIVGFAWNLILSPLWGVAEGALKAVGLGACSHPGSACPRPRWSRWR